MTCRRTRSRSESRCRGSQSIATFADLADHLIAVEPDAELVQQWDEANDNPHSRKIGQLPVCWGPDRDASITRAHELFRWFGGGWKVNAELPGPAGFAGASQFVTEDDVADSIPCVPDLDAIVKAVRQFEDAGFTRRRPRPDRRRVAARLPEVAEEELLPALRG